jgi:hypothetical protein
VLYLVAKYELSQEDTDDDEGRPEKAGYMQQAVQLLMNLRKYEELLDMCELLGISVNEACEKPDADMLQQLRDKLVQIELRSSCLKYVDDTTFFDDNFRVAAKPDVPTIVFYEHNRRGFFVQDNA